VVPDRPDCSRVYLDFDALPQRVQNAFVADFIWKASREEND